MKSLSSGKFIIAALVAAVMMFGGITVFADTFLPPQPFEIWSEDGTTVFRWNPGPVDNWWQGTAQADVYRNGELIYSVENLPITGESAAGFFFSEDFTYLVFIPSVSQVMALGFFENGVLLRSYRIDELVRNMDVVTYSVTTASWENWSGRYFDSTNNTLTIVTRDDITYVFDITTGEIIYDTVGDMPFVPHSEDSFGFFVNRDAALPLWAQPQAVQPEPPLLHGLDIASEWATASITRAHSLGLIPTSMFAFPTFTDYTLPATRAEFAALAVALYETVAGREIAGRMGFNDTTDINVQKMGYLGVVSGIGGGYFAPNNTLTREQAATMLSRLSDVLDHPLPDELPTFADNDSISSWAVGSVGQMQIAGIMSGVGNNMFAPSGYYTREQSIVTILRLFDLLNIDGANNDTDVPPPPGVSNFEVGRVRLVTDVAEYEPGIHFVHGAMYVDEGLLSASGISFEQWLESHFNDLLEIRYTPNLQIIVDGEYGQIVTFSHQEQMYHAGVRTIGILAESFIDGVSNISLPNETGAYLVYVDVWWSGDGEPFTLSRYVFKIVR